MTFKSSKKVQALCEVDLCKEFEKERGKAACRVNMDIPDKCNGKAGKSCTLLFYFHGSGGNNKKASFKKEVRSKYSGPGFIGIYPQGVKKGEVDEGRFIKAIVSALKKYYGWNGLKFAVGSSKGANQANRIALNSGYGFDGVAAMATQLLASPPTSGLGELNQNTITNTTKPIPYLNLHGSADKAIPANGGKAFFGGLFLSVADTLKAFATLNDCADKNEPSDIKTIPAVEKTKNDLKAIVTTYDCKASLPVQGVMVINGSHSIATKIGGVSKLQYVFNWFLALRKNL